MFLLCFIDLLACVCKRELDDVFFVTYNPARRDSKAASPAAISARRRCAARPPAPRRYLVHRCHMLRYHYLLPRLLRRVRGTRSVPGGLRAPSARREDRRTAAQQSSLTQHLYGAARRLWFGSVSVLVGSVGALSKERARRQWHGGRVSTIASFRQRRRAGEPGGEPSGGAGGLHVGPTPFAHILLAAHVACTVPLACAGAAHQLRAGPTCGPTFFLPRPYFRLVHAT
jgi:hypothetical protein